MRFGDPGWRLGYARDALNSYFVFKTLKEKGVLAKHLRFQVSVPMVNSVLPPRIFPDQNDLAKIRPGLLRPRSALSSTPSSTTSRITSWRSSGIAQRRSKTPTARCRAIRLMARSSAISVRFAHYRRTSPRMSLSAITSVLARSADGRVLRRTISASGEACQRRGRGLGTQGGLDPSAGLDRHDDGFFAPLKTLEPQGARVYLGMVHNMAGFKARLETARKFLPSFGLGAYCGFGRMPNSALPQVLRDHLDAAEIARAM